MLMNVDAEDAADERADGSAPCCQSLMGQLGPGSDGNRFLAPVHNSHALRPTGMPNSRSGLQSVTAVRQSTGLEAK